MTTAARVPLPAAIAVTVFALWLLVGVGILAAPRDFYGLTPGLPLFGPFNAHFIRDVGLVYAASGPVGLYGARTASAALCLAAAVGSCLHAHGPRTRDAVNCLDALTSPCSFVSCCSKS
jgi:hypothetical protein